MGLVKGCWIVIKNGTNEQGVSGLVELLSKAGCRVEVEAKSSEPSPKYFAKVDRWTVIWDGYKAFNINALRKGQDMLICSSEEVLSSLLEAVGGSDLLTLGTLCRLQESVTWPLQIRTYEVENDA
jgi:hypothetical protein